MNINISNISTNIHSTLLSRLPLLCERCFAQLINRNNIPKFNSRNGSRNRRTSPSNISTSLSKAPYRPKRSLHRGTKSLQQNCRGDRQRETTSSNAPKLPTCLGQRGHEACQTSYQQEQIVDERCRLPPLEPFDHVEHGKVADPTFPDLLSGATSFNDITPNIGAEVRGVQLSSLTNAGKDQLALLTAQKKVVGKS